jgi:hypothetical protein
MDFKQWETLGAGSRNFTEPEADAAVHTGAAELGWENVRKRLGSGARGVLEDARG